MKEYQKENRRIFKTRWTNIIFYLEKINASNTLIDRVYNLNSLVADFDTLDYPISTSDEKNILLTSNESIIMNYVEIIERKIYNSSITYIESHIDLVNKQFNMFYNNYSSLMNHVSAYNYLSSNEDKIVGFQEFNKNMVMLKELIDKYEKAEV